MEKNVHDRELGILKIIEKHPGIHHRILLKIIHDKDLMAKGTAEKCIKNLIKSNTIVVYKYGKEVQYVLSDGELSEKDLKKKVSYTIKKLIYELEIIDKKFDDFDYYIKRNMPDYLIQTLTRLLETKSNLLKSAKETKLTDMSYAQELFYEIRDLTKNYSIDDKTTWRKRDQAAKTTTHIDKTQREYSKLLEKRSKVGSSKLRSNMNIKLKNLNSDILKSYRTLENIRDELKSMHKN